MEKEIRRAASLLVKARYAVGLTGAGISVESGIRPFRGPKGLWAEYGEPLMDGYQRFMADPEAHWAQGVKQTDYMLALYQSLAAAKPNAAHIAMAGLEQNGVLKFLITQNVDNLHQAAGSLMVAEIHGSVFRLRCLKCFFRYDAGDEVDSNVPPSCPICGGIVKSDAVMFGEPIPTDILVICEREVNRSDCMLCVGTSAHIYPAAGFPLRIRQRGGVLIEINPCETNLTRICNVSIRATAGRAMPELLDAVNQEVRGGLLKNFIKGV